MNLRHITRFTYEFTNFQGWRVAISRQGTTLARYFSDKQYGGSEEAREQAITFRDMVLEEIRVNPEKTRDILYKYRVKAAKISTKGKDGSVVNMPELQAQECRENTQGNQQSMLNNLKKLCHYLKLDTVGMLRLSMSLFILQHTTATAMPQEDAKSAQAILREMSQVVSDSQLQSLVDLLERNPAVLSESLEETEPTTALTQVPDEEIRAKESTPVEHNTSPPEAEQESPATSPPDEIRNLRNGCIVHNIRPPRPSPLEQRSVYASTDSPQHPIPQSSILLSSISKQSTVHPIEHHKPTQFDRGLEYAASRPPEVI